MNEILKIFLDRKWGASSILFALFLPGFYQLAVNNYAFYLKSDVTKIIILSFAISAPTYLLAVIGTLILQFIITLLYLIFSGAVYKKRKSSYAYIIGFINILIVFPSIEYDIYKDNPLKYLRIYMNSKELIWVTIMIFFFLSILKLFFLLREERTVIIK